MIGHSILCKHNQENWCCKFGEGWAYAYIETVKKNDANKLSEEIKSMKAHMEILKNTVSDKMQEKQIMVTIECLHQKIL